MRNIIAGSHAEHLLEPADALKTSQDNIFHFSRGDKEIHWWIDFNDTIWGLMDPWTSSTCSNLLQGYNNPWWLDGWNNVVSWLMQNIPFGYVLPINPTPKKKKNKYLVTMGGGGEKVLYSNCNLGMIDIKP